MPPSGEKMWQTNYMDSYNKVKKKPIVFKCSSRYGQSPTRSTSQRTTHSARPKTASASRNSLVPKPTLATYEPATPNTPLDIYDPNRPKSASSFRGSVRPKTASSVHEKSKPILTFEEFSKQYNNLKVKFDSHGYVIPQKYFPPEIDFAVQGKHIPLSERNNKAQDHHSTNIAVNLPAPEKEEKAEEKKKEDEENEVKDENENPDEVPTVPDASNNPKGYHWICWPEPKPEEEEPKRPHTSLGIYRAPTPYGGGPGDDIEDRPSSVIPGYCFGDNEDITRGPPMTYVPELKSWINSSNDYDKDVAQNLMAMYSSLAPPLPPEALRPKRQMTFSYGGRRSHNSNYNSMADPLTHYSQSWRPLYEDTRPLSRQQELRHSVPNFPQIPGLERSKTDLRPMQRSVIRYPRTDDYVHERSMFMTTQPPCTGHFIIHPDWVSEKSGKRKLSAARLKKKNASKNGLRYGTQYEM